MVIFGGFLFLGGCLLYSLGVIYTDSIAESLTNRLTSPGMILSLAGAIMGTGGLFIKGRKD